MALSLRLFNSEKNIAECNCVLVRHKLCAVSSVLGITYQDQR